MRNMVTANSNRGPLVSKPGAKRRIITGAKIIPTRVKTNNARPSEPVMALIKRRISSDERVFWYSDKTGTKACEKAPSAKSRRMKLGMRKAMEKASNWAAAPKKCAVTISRMNPKTREIMVILTTTVVDLMRLLLMLTDPHKKRILLHFYENNECLLLDQIMDLRVARRDSQSKLTSTQKAGILRNLLTIPRKVLEKNLG